MSEIKVDNIMALEIVLQTKSIAVPANAIIAMLQHMAKDGTIIFSKMTKTQIMRKTGIAPSTLSKYIHVLAEHSILVPVKNCRGTYMCNLNQQLNSIIFDNFDWVVQLNPVKKSCKVSGQLKLEDLIL